MHDDTSSSVLLEFVSSSQVLATCVLCVALLSLRYNLNWEIVLHLLCMCLYPWRWQHFTSEGTYEIVFTLSSTRWHVSRVTYALPPDLTKPFDPVFRGLSCLPEVGLFKYREAGLSLFLHLSGKAWGCAPQLHPGPQLGRSGVSLGGAFLESWR